MNVHTFFLLVCIVGVSVSSCGLKARNEAVARKESSSALTQSPNFTQNQETTAQSQNPPVSEQDPCKGAVTQQDLNDCSEKDYRKWDDELNKVYDHIMASLEERNQFKLREVQKKWIEYRDANCEAEREYHGGSMALMIQAFCLRDNTKDRIKELERIYSAKEKEGN